ncbi:kinase-like domain-containing protein [Phyllosticta capitalensis]
MARIKLSSLNGHFTSNYAVGKYLGGGADGKVYKAKCKATGTVYAAKIIVRRTQGSRPHEAHINSLLKRDPKFQHHIVKFSWCFGAVGPKMPVVLVFEHCELGTLEAYITSKWGKFFQAKNVVPLEITLRVWVQLLHALKFLHEPAKGSGRGPIVHRDIKPWNIVVTKSPHGHPLPHVKLCDFGGALEATSTNIRGRKPQRPGGLAAFTRGFAPPELGWPPKAKAYESAKPAYDVYSLGATIYWIIRRITPPTDTNIIAPRGPVSKEDYCEQFWKVLKGALQKKSRSRWSKKKLLNGLKEGWVTIDSSRLKVVEI